MYYKTKRFLTLALVLALLFAFSLPAMAKTTSDSMFAFQKAVGIRVNQERAKSAALALDTELCNIALKLAMEQEGGAVEEGTRKDGTDWKTILLENGYSYVEAGSIQLSSKSVLSSKELVEQYLRDSLDRKTLTYSRYTLTGVSQYYSEADGLYYYAQLFVRPVSGHTEAPDNTHYAYRAIAKTGVNVRAAAGTQYEITGGLGKGQTVLVASVSGKWAKIFWDNSAYAYVHTSYIKKVADLGAATATARVNVRSGAGTEFSILGSLKRKESVEILGYEGNWAKVIFEGKAAYVSLDYLK
ncbi:SH3 domain-containing protein [Christensenellaceae bacterium OttesenSCG-928-L17]|nr:SH3 domain-containing protein [Christensenellaceae bacterium OttesenSCG-928-L17]